MKRTLLNTSWALMLSLGACKKNGGIEVYSVDKKPAEHPHVEENPHGKSLPMVNMPAADDGAADPHSGMGVLPAPGFTDEAPDHWLEKKRTAMRMASYLVEGEGGAQADISFTSLRSVPGSLLANINRWRGQVGQAPWSEEDLREKAGTVPTCFGDAVVVDAAGLIEKADPKQDGRIVGAIAEKDGRAWFYKMRGNADVVGREKGHFLAWIQTLKPVEQVEAIPAPPASPEVEWELPAGWTAAFGGQSRYATLSVPAGSGEPTQLVVSFFPGDVGGDAANVNRWRGQVSLPSLGDDEALAQIGQLEAGEKTLSLVDLKGPSTRMLAAWTRHGEHTWFFKWTGSDAVLEASKPTFTAFLQSIRFNTPE